MEQRFVKPLVIFFVINFQKFIIKKILVYTGTMDQAIFKNVSGSKAEKIKKVIFLMLRTDFFASPTMKSHKYIKNQTTHHPF